jgi:hypothetical protein
VAIALRFFPSRKWEGQTRGGKLSRRADVPRQAGITNSELIAGQMGAVSTRKNLKEFGNWLAPGKVGLVKSQRKRGSRNESGLFLRLAGI